MPSIVFQVDIEAERSQVAHAIASEAGIRGWWTEAAAVPDGVGKVLRLGFAMAPFPFELRIEEASEERVRWASVGAFPPHWTGTEMQWDVADNPDGTGTRVQFRHSGWPSDDGMFGATAYTWGQLMASLKAYAETGSTAMRLPSAPIEA